MPQNNRNSHNYPEKKNTTTSIILWANDAARNFNAILSPDTYIEDYKVLGQSILKRIFRNISVL